MDEYKQMIIDSGTRDIVYTASVSGIPANWMVRSLEAAGITKEMWDQSKKVDFGEELDTEAKAWKNLWSAGHGVATIHDNPPAAELIERIGKEFRAALNDQVERANKYVA